MLPTRLFVAETTPKSLNRHHPLPFSLFHAQHYIAFYSPDQTK
jgi:hypothetical protein